MELDIQKSLVWYREAAAQGYAKAQFNLGALLHGRKDGTPEERLEALGWYEKAADQ